MVCSSSRANACDIGQIHGGTASHQDHKSHRIVFAGCLSVLDASPFSDFLVLGPNVAWTHCVHLLSAFARSGQPGPTRLLQMPARLELVTGYTLARLSRMAVCCKMQPTVRRAPLFADSRLCATLKDLFVIATRFCRLLVSHHLSQCGSKTTYAQLWCQCLLYGSRNRLHAWRAFSQLTGYTARRRSRPACRALRVCQVRSS